MPPLFGLWRSGFLPKNRAKLQDNHNVFSEYLRENADSMDQFREPGVRLYG